MAPIMTAGADKHGAGIAACGNWLDQVMSDAPMTMYTTSWCGYCVRLKTMLTADGIAYHEVNIEEDPAAAQFVSSVNGGNKTVPTVRFGDGSTLTNPNVSQVKQKLAELAS
jgi:mycoredoxin